MGNDTRSDRARLKDAFTELRGRGWVAHANFMCCQNCGCAAIYDEAAKELGRPMTPEEDAALKYAFWHDQDDDSFRPWPHEGGRKTATLHKPLCIAWGGDGYELKSVLESQGLEVEWNGSDTQRVQVLPRPENRRPAGW